MAQARARRPSQSHSRGQTQGDDAAQAALEPQAAHPQMERGAGGREVDHTTGEEIDAYIQGDEFFYYYIRSSFDREGNGADGHISILDAEAFQARWIQYAMARLNPNTGERFTADEAAAYQANAFVDGDQIVLHANRGEAGTAIHESMHIFTHSSYLPQMGFNINEGTTEFFTRLLCERVGVRRSSVYYREQRRVMEDVVAALPRGHNILASAYFDGDINRLREAMNQGAGNEQRFEQWKAFMQAGDFRSARALF